ncbi:sigma-70 family RNA polymerase sigma factor [Isoptericola sp. 4D.3]|uniref:Sigma-70 family RNA polymerase sigma factor n=1 Tax=Isoptericola peretonis TaxID=2918523 RepID=A0ABT0J7E7_9MICO|nr:sigma-70 family RNA polymerase sigma factor [Isoptericola sp. 4D.3]
MSTPDDAAGPRERLAALWSAHAVRVQAYLWRHTDPDTAQDLLSETFLVAWRRIDDVPDPALPWLLVVARNLVRNAHRAARRRRTLDDDLASLEASAPLPEAAPEALAVERDTLLRGLARLTEREREALLLVAWDGLAPPEAAAVAGCSTATFHVRLHRARRRLAPLAEDGAGGPDRSPGVPRSPAPSRRTA